MRANRTILLAVLLAACAHPAPPREPAKSYRQHLDLAAAHDRAAETEERLAAEAQRGGTGGYACGDRALTDQVTSGGERVTTWVPCWNTDRDASAAHLAAAERLRAEARQHRAIAGSLIDVERMFCAGFPEEELSHTPLFHRRDIAAVAPLRDGDRLVGATVTFKAVPGLTPGYLRHALLCHRARMATLGYPTTYMAYDPSMLVDTRIGVEDRGGPIVVTVRADDDVAAAVVWSRAQALLGQR